MGQCRLCNQECKLVNAHAIPESFFRVMRSDSGKRLLLSNPENSFPVRAPIGVYDENILCEECEKTFGEVDSYAAQVLLTKFHELFKPVVHLGSNVALQSQEIDQELLLRFFVATLWRASVSTHPFYSRVQLGGYEAQARDATDLGCPIPKTFAVVLSFWSDGVLRYGALDPYLEMWSGINAYRIYLGQVVAYIKVDNRPFPSPLDELALCRQDSVYIAARNFTESKDLAAMRKTVEQSHQREQMARRTSGRQRR